MAHVPRLASNDDWSSIEEAAERRKRQNRVHQRAWRQKRNTKVGPEAKPREQGWTGYGKLVLTVEDTQPSSQSGRPRILASRAPALSSWQDRTGSEIDGRDGKRSSRIIIPPLIPHPSKNQGRPIRILFPLSPDHHLITLVQYNVKRALLTNMNILGLTHRLPQAHRGVFSVAWTPIEPPESIPESLYPTPLQKSVPHDLFIDTIPIAALRDGFILNEGAYDMDELNGDLYGGLFGGYTDAENRGVMVWGDPWRGDSWEVTDGFMRKWGYLLNGCEETIKSTNKWRDSRGEDRLVVEL